MSLLEYFLQFYTTDQIIAIIISAKVSYFASIVGSIYVVQDVLRSPNKRNDSIYHRVMLGVAVSDFITVFGLFLGTWPMPKASMMFAVGNEEACYAVGIFTSLGLLLSPLYNCSLATYYLLELKCQWNAQRMKSSEKWLHILPWVLSLINPFLAALTEGFGPYNWICGTTSKIAIIFSSFLYVLAIIYVIGAMFLVYKHVRDIEKKAQAYAFASFYCRGSQKNVRKRSRRVMIQGIMYAAAMLLVFIPLFINIVIFSIILKKELFVVEIIVGILPGFQGVYNAFIFSGKLQNWFYNYDGLCPCCCKGDSTQKGLLSPSLTSTKKSRTNSSINEKKKDSKQEEECKDEIKSLNNSSMIFLPKENVTNALGQASLTTSIKAATTRSIEQPTNNAEHFKQFNCQLANSNTVADDDLQVVDDDLQVADNDLQDLNPIIRTSDIESQDQTERQREEELQSKLLDRELIR